MLERMIIDISKWIIIILIFFIAFACSLYLIFSYFAVALQQHNHTNQSLYEPESPSLSFMRNDRFIIKNSSRCPKRFTELMINASENIVYFEDDDQNTTDDNDTCKATKNYDKIKKVGRYPALHYFGETFGATILTTFFTLFGVIAEDGIPDRGYELVSRTCLTPDEKTYAPGFDVFTSNLGFIIFGLFTFICVTVLINTLIAMMEETIDAIDDRADVEWKFARSRLYMEYIRDGNTLPVPFNICPTPISLIHQIKRIKQMMFPNPSATNANDRANGKKDDPLDDLNIRRRNNILNSKSTQHDRFKNERIFDCQRSYVIHETLTYKIVIERIVKRFLLYYKNKHIGLDETNDGMEFKEFKNDISSLRFELFNEVDILDDMRQALLQSMKLLNDDLHEHFDIEQMKNQLNEQKL